MAIGNIMPPPLIVGLMCELRSLGLSMILHFSANLKYTTNTAARKAGMIICMTDDRFKTSFIKRGNSFNDTFFYPNRH